MRRAPAAALVAATAGLTVTSCQIACACLPPVAFAVVFGQVTDAAGIPAPGIRVEANGVRTGAAPCDRPGGGAGGVSGDFGFYHIDIADQAGGEACYEILVRFAADSSIVIDTVIVGGTFAEPHPRVQLDIRLPG